MNHFNEFGHVNEPGCCIWCGRKLRKKFDSEPIDPTNPVRGYRKLKTFKLGDYRDGFFCGLRCGYKFAVRLAQLGQRLQPVRSKHVSEVQS